MGLVELSEEEQARLSGEPEEPMDSDEIERLLAETRAMTGELEPGAEASSSEAPGAGADAGSPFASSASSAATPTASDGPPPAPVDGLPEGRPFAELYAEAGIPDSPYPAEQLLRLLDGLKAMEPGVRKAAVIAMDAADERWTLQDSVLDAERKIRALEAICTELDGVVSSTEASATEQLALQDARAAEASERIRAQIAEMEALLATEVQTVADEKSAIQRHLDAVRGARERERSRLTAEMQRLRSLYPMFKDPDAEH